MYRLASLIVIGAVVAAGFAVYAEPPADPGDDPPVLLKKKGAPVIEDPPPPADDKVKDKDAKDKDKKPADAPKPDAGNAQPDQPQQDPDEVLNRASKDMHRAEDRLANKGIDDAARQAQDDALKDLDQLIDLNENPPPSKDDQKSNSSNSSKSDSSKSGSAKSDPSKSASGSSGHSGSSGTSGRKSKGRGRGRQGMRQRSGSQPGGMATGDKRQSGGKSGQQPGDPNGKSANGGNGGGGKDSPTLKDHNADLYKDVWGHLPETLRAEMNAYSNTKGFMPEYESLISQYYRTIAEQGRRRGD